LCMHNAEGLCMHNAWGGCGATPSKPAGTARGG
jgi:hypothetical protein